MGTGGLTMTPKYAWELNFTLLYSTIPRSLALFAAKRKRLTEGTLGLLLFGSLNVGLRWGSSEV